MHSTAFLLALRLLAVRHLASMCTVGLLGLCWGSPGCSRAEPIPKVERPSEAEANVDQVADLRDLPANELAAELALVASQPGVEEVVLAGKTIDDDLLVEVAALPQVKRLKLENTSIGDATLRRLGRANRLELLYVLDAPAVTPAGIAALGQLTRLRNLRLSGAAVNDDSLQQLSALTGLAALALQHTQVTDGGLRSLPAFNQLRELSLLGTPITDAGLASIAKLPELSKLRLRQTRVTGQQAEALAQLPVVDLELAETPFGNQGMGAIARMPRLERLNLWLTKIDDSGLEMLRGNRQLRSLNLDNIPAITDQSLGVIATMENLEFLHLGKTGVTESGLPQLQGLKHLTTLHITDLGVSEQGVWELTTAMPGLRQVVRD